MKKIYFLLLTGLTCIAAIGQTSGGPDLYGYEWRNNLDAQGPSVNWIDITTVGTQVAGLADDNSVAFIPMGMDFHYYWSDYNQIKIGSNGWLSFNNVSNIAHCFPTMPSPGGNGDNIIAPLMGDLNFAGGTNPGEVWYYFDSANDQFIVSYINVPFWVNSNPDFTGSNTFQVILSNQDSSITFQYDQIDATFNDVAGCSADVSSGIENVTGNIGLQVTLESMPASNSAVKFYYPNPVTFAIEDIAPVWSQNIGNQANFYVTGSSISIPVEIGNVGNSDVAANTVVELTIRDLSLTQQFFVDSVIGNLTMGSTQTVMFEVPSLSVGQYYVEVNTVNVNDINPSNNARTTEIEVVDVSQPSVLLSYATQNAPDGSISWSGGSGSGDGVAIHIVPPVYPTTLESVEMYIVQGANDLANQSGYTVEILADDGPSNSPGTLLASESVATGSYTPGSWVSTMLSSPLIVASGGVYVAWKMDGDSLAMGTETVGPISRRTYEYLGGSYSPYRNSTVEDFLINAYFKDFAVGVTELNNSLSEINVYPNPNKGTFVIDATSSIETVDVKVMSVIGEIVYYSSINKGSKSVINLSTMNKGVYLIHMTTSTGVKTERIIIN